MPARRASLPTLAFRQQLSPPLSLSHCSRESQEWKRRRYAACWASFSASQPSALICLSDACSTVLRLCSQQRKHRAAAFLLKKPFNLGFKALPGREFNLRDLWFPMLGVCILSVGFSIPSLRVTTREYCRHNQRIPPASRHKYRK